MIETTPQFLWRALTRNPAIVAEATGKVMEYAIPQFTDVPDEHCWLCGGETHHRGLMRASRITKEFSDVDFAAYPESKSLCEGCAGMQFQRMLRCYSLFATEAGLRHPARAAWREILITPPPAPWVAAIATTGQKHLFYKADINRGSLPYSVLLEDYRILYIPAELREMLSLIEQLYTVFSKAEIETGRWNQARITKYGFARWRRDAAEADKLRGSRLFSLALFIAQREEVPEDAGAAEPEPAAPLDAGGPAGSGGAASAGTEPERDRAADGQAYQIGQQTFAWAASEAGGMDTRRAAAPAGTRRTRGYHG